MIKLEPYQNAIQIDSYIHMAMDSIKIATEKEDNQVQNLTVTYQKVNDYQNQNFEWYKISFKNQH